jgi:hypothetical protein
MRGRREGLLLLDWREQKEKQGISEYFHKVQREG